MRVRGRGNPTSPTPFLLLPSSISVIFSVSRSSWFLKSVTALLSSRAAAWTESTRSRVCFVALASTSSSTLSSLTELLVACMSSYMSARSSRNAGVSTEFTASLTVEAIAESEVLCCSLNASLIPLATASSISSLYGEICEFFFIGDCPISLFRSPLTVEVLMMDPMQSGSKFTLKVNFLIVWQILHWTERLMNQHLTHWLNCKLWLFPVRFLCTLPAGLGLNCPLLTRQFYTPCLWPHTSFTLIYKSCQEV